jgi:hypothetical protein
MKRSNPTVLLSLSFLILLSLSGSAQNGHRPKNMLEVENLRGPVRSVEWTSAQGSEDIRVAIPRSREVYDREGFLIDRYQFDGRGAVSLHTSFTRNRWAVTKEVRDSAKPEESNSVVVQENPKNGTTVREQFDANGTLLSTMESAPEGSSSVRPKSEDAQDEDRTIHSRYKYDPASHLSTSTDTKSGEVTNQSASRWNEAGVVSVNKSADGSFTETTQNTAGYVVKLHMYNAPTKTDSLQVNDDRGRTIESVQSSPGAYFKSIFTYEEDGSLATETMLDRDGKAVDTFRYEYLDDSYGNWVEQRRFARHSSDKAPQWSQDTTTRRMITYY